MIGDKNNYQDFIALIDAMKLANQETYGVDAEKTHHFFAVHMCKKPNEKATPDTVCGRVIEGEYYKKKHL